MTQQVTAFYRALGALLFVGGIVLTGVVFVLRIPVDKFVLATLTLAYLGGLALIRPEIFNRAVRYAASKLPGKNGETP